MCLFSILSYLFQKLQALNSRVHASNWSPWFSLSNSKTMNLSQKTLNDMAFVSKCHAKCSVDNHPIFFKPTDMFFVIVPQYWPKAGFFKIFQGFNPFTTGCVFKNVLQGPGNTPMLFTKLCPIIKNHKIRLSVSFLVPFESSFKELFFGHKKSFIHPYLPRAFSRWKNARRASHVYIRGWAVAAHLK